MNHLVSVVIPAFNASQSLEASFLSILNQTFSGCIEVIIVDDGSTDDTLLIAQGFLVYQSSTLTVKTYSQVNQGVSSARNQGIFHASGDLIAFLDSDDIWHPFKLEIQVRELMNNPDISAIGANRNGERYPFFVRSRLPLYSLSTLQVLLKWYPHTSTLLLRRSLVDKVGFYNTKMSHAEDGEYLIRITHLAQLWVIDSDLVLTGGGKRAFGVSGLSADLFMMYEGELRVLRYSLHARSISYLQFLLLYIWLSLKYIRRLLVSSSAFCFRSSLIGCQ
jgi:glycosyltransferase involved in cell wall biosynthesis